MGKTYWPLSLLRRGTIFARGERDLEVITFAVFLDIAVLAVADMGQYFDGGVKLSPVKKMGES